VARNNSDKPLVMAGGPVTIILQSRRDLGSAGAPCGGYLAYGEVVGDDVPDASTRRLNAPHVFEMIERALGRNPEFGSLVRLRLHVEVLDEPAPSPKACHNPWPAHRCRRG
jgi:hypothetical protein